MLPPRETSPGPAQVQAHARVQAQAGVTLVEVLIASTIAAVLAVALANVFSNVLAVSREATAGRSLDRIIRIQDHRQREDPAELPFPD